MAYPESKMDEMQIFSPDWVFINPLRPKLLETYNQGVRGLRFALKRADKALRRDPRRRRLSLSIAPGNIVALLGPSSCGKTTTLRMIAGLVEPNAGDIFIDDRRITRVPVHRRNIGVLFQNYALFPQYDGCREHRLRPGDAQRQGECRGGAGGGRIAPGAAVRLR